MITSTSLKSPRLINNIKAAAIDSINTRRPRWVYNRRGEPFMYVHGRQYFDTNNRDITATVVGAMQR